MYLQAIQTFSQLPVFHLCSSCPAALGLTSFIPSVFLFTKELKVLWQYLWLESMSSSLLTFFSVDIDFHNHPVSTVSCIHPHMLCILCGPFYTIMQYSDTVHFDSRRYWYLIQYLTATYMMKTKVFRAEMAAFQLLVPSVKGPGSCNECVFVKLISHSEKLTWVKSYTRRSFISFFPNCCHELGKVWHLLSWLKSLIHIDKEPNNTVLH